MGFNPLLVKMGLTNIKDIWANRRRPYITGFVFERLDKLNSL